MTSKLDRGNPRPVLRKTQLNDLASALNNEKSGSKLSEMSPSPAVKENPKRYLTSRTKQIMGTDQCYNEIKYSASGGICDNSSRIWDNVTKRIGHARESNSSPRVAKVKRSRDSPDAKRLPTANVHANQTSTARSPSALSQTSTARSPSSRSRADPAYSISDNKSNKTTTSFSPSGAVDTANDNSSKQPRKISKGEDNNGNRDSNSDWPESKDADTSSNRNSFVLALDKALDENQIRRLQGDVTDKIDISEPGLVRALNGGRLANAQEVVVNVCHEDHKELVFHDNDLESLDNARTISDIKINIWLKYNAEFQADNTTDDLDIETSAKADNSAKNEEKGSRKGTELMSCDKKENIVAEVNKISSAPNRDSYKRRSLIRRHRHNGSLALEQHPSNSGAAGDISPPTAKSTVSTEDIRQNNVRSGDYLKLKSNIKPSK